MNKIRTCTVQIIYKPKGSRKCVIPVVCVKLGKLYVVKHNCVTDLTISMHAYVRVHAYSKILSSPKTT